MRPFDKDPLRDYTSRKRTPVVLIGALVAALVIGLGAGVLAMSSGGNDSKSSGDFPQLASGQGPDIGPTQVAEAPTPEATPEPPPPTPVPEPTQVPQLTNLGSGDRLSI